MCIRDRVTHQLEVLTVAIPAAITEGDDTNAGFDQAAGDEAVSYTHLTLPTSDLV